MDNVILAVLIHENNETCKALEDALGDLPVECHCVKSLSDARDLIAEHHPLLVFVGLASWRRSRAEIVNLATAIDQSYNVIVVGAVSNIELYVASIEQGAYSYVAPPFSSETLSQVVDSAATDARERREDLMQWFTSDAAELVGQRIGP